MNNGIVRCAVIGAGIFGTTHAEFLAGRADAKLAAIADLRLEVAEELAKRTGSKAYAQYEEMLAKESLDLVLIETPDHLHKLPAIACCQAGVPNLVIQKPLSSTVDDAQAIVNAAAAAGTRLFMWYGNRAWGMDMATQYAIRSGLIGKVVYGDCTLDDNVDVPLGMWGTRTRDQVSNLSPLAFLGTHVLDRLLWYFAPARVVRVYAIEQRQVLANTADLYDVFLSFDNGVKVRLKAGWIHCIEGVVESSDLFNGFDGQVISNRSAKFNTQQGWRVNFRNEISFDDLRHHQNVLSKRGIRSRVIYREPNTGWKRGIACGLEIPAGETLNHELLEFVLDAIREDTFKPKSWTEWQGSGPLPTVEAAMENVRVIAAIEKSAREETQIDVLQV